MKTAKELLDFLKNVNNDGMDDVFPAVVKTVDKAAATCEVEYNKNTLGNVRLKALVQEESSDNGFVIYPEPGSDVLVKKLSVGLLSVYMFSEVESIVWQVGNKKYSVDQNGHEIKGGNDSLLDVIKLIIEAVQIVVVSQGTNPDYAKLQQALLKVNNILK